jgi:hypothetical protein
MRFAGRAADLRAPHEPRAVGRLGHGIFSGRGAASPPVAALSDPLESPRILQQIYKSKPAWRKDFLAANEQR